MDYFYKECIGGFLIWCGIVAAISGMAYMIHDISKKDGIKEIDCIQQVGIDMCKKIYHDLDTN